MVLGMWHDGNRRVVCSLIRSFWWAWHLRWIRHHC